MPGRVFLTATAAELAAHFDAAAGDAPDPGPRPEIGPGDTVLAVVAGRRLAAMRWGLIPMGRTNARGRPVLETLVNARAETLFAKSAFAAVWDMWQAPGGAEVASLALVTCAPSADVAPVHDRMPAILDRDRWPVWLGEAEGDPAGLLRPLADGRLSAERD